MPTVTLAAREIRDNQLPAVCILCGAPAVAREPRKFVWFPGCIWFTLLIAWPLFVVLWIMLVRNMHTALPVCATHTGVWRRRRRMLWLLAAGLVLAVGVGLPALFAIPLGPTGDPAVWVIFAGIVLVVAPVPVF